MKGTVIYYDPETDCFSLKIDDEKIVIFECSDEYDIRIGDELLGNIGPLGKTLLLNVTNKESIEAIVKEIK